MFAIYHTFWWASTISKKTELEDDKKAEAKNLESYATRPVKSKTYMYITYM